jgi:hypothetical protein
MPLQRLRKGGAALLLERCYSPSIRDQVEGEVGLSLMKRASDILSVILLRLIDLRDRRRLL